MADSADDRFREMFFEEARELLIGLEEGLMDLERRQEDRAHLDKTFRAAHSLKGAAAMVGLPAIAEFTHGIEAVLELVRSGGLPVDSDIITTLLEARDHLAAMIEGEAVGSPIAASSELSQRMSGLLGGGPRGQGAPSSAPPPNAGTASSAPSSPSVPAKAPGDTSAEVANGPSAPPGPGPSEGAGGASEEAPALKSARSGRKGGTSKPRAPRRKKTAAQSAVSAESASAGKDDARNEYRIVLAPGPEALRRGINPIGVLEELGELGAARLEANLEQVPPLDQLDPERCYLTWTVALTTVEPLERLQEVFLFFTEDDAVTIERRTDDGGWAAAGPSEPVLAVVTAAPARTHAANRSGAGATEQPGPASGPGGAKTGAGAGGFVASGAPAPTNGAPAPRVPTRPHPRIRVDAGQLDDLVGLAGELAVLSDNLMGLREMRGADRWLHALESLQRVSREIRDTTLDLRMVPVDELFSRFPRVVRDLADQSGKEIELRIVGQDTKLDRTIVERLSDPMVHLIRNAVDHALEPPSDRERLGKPRVGRITLSAGHEGDRVAVRVEDDGRGLDCDKIVRKGIALGMIAPGTAPDDPRVVSLIFEPGFSTRDAVTDLSGRGVGLDVVRDAVRALRGTVAVESTSGKGTSFVFRLPLTLALIDGLLVQTGAGKYVVPLAQVEECVALNGGTRSALDDVRPCVSVRGDLVPMVSLRRLFRADGEAPARQELLLTRHAGQRVGIAVDRLLGRVQAVIQSLGEGLHEVGRFSGATILGDGSVSLILDLSALVSESRFAEQSARGTPSPGGGGRAEGLR